MYLGDFAEDQELHFAFSTRGTDGASITFAGTPAVEVYKDDGLTQSSAGVTLTVDHDGVTGKHHVKIDLGADPFYAAGADYSVVVSAGTVDGVSVVGQVLANFSVENRYMRGTHNAATASALATAQADLDTLTGADGATLATSQPNYVPATASALAAAQSDLDTLTGPDGATLAASQPNYAPLKPTVAGRTLDITAGGCAGIDWGNLENPGAANDLAATVISLADAVATVQALADSAVDQVWDEDLAGHAGAGADIAAILSALAALNDLDAAGVRAAIGMAAADLDAQLATLATAASLATLNDLSPSEAGDAVLDEVVEGSWTLRQLIRIFASALAGKLSGAATPTVTIRDINDSKDRITASVDADGNRTSVSLDAS